MIARVRLGEVAAANGLCALPSATNFATIDSRPGGDHARRVPAALIERDVFRHVPGITLWDR